MVAKEYVPDRMDIVWTDLSPARGHEQANLRPVLVLSERKYNARTGLMVVCAITTRIKGYSYEVTFKELKVEGAVLSDQMRNLDWRARGARFVQKMPPDVFEEVKENIETLLFE